MRKSLLVLISLTTMLLPSWAAAGEAPLEAVVTDLNHRVHAEVLASPDEAASSAWKILHGKSADFNEAIREEEQFLQVREFSPLIANGLNFEGGMVWTTITIQNINQSAARGYTATFFDHVGGGLLLRSLIRSNGTERVGNSLVGGLSAGSVTNIKLFGLPGETALRTGWVFFQLDPDLVVSVDYSNFDPIGRPLYKVPTNPQPLSFVSTLSFELTPRIALGDNLYYRESTAGIAIANPNDSQVTVTVMVTNYNEGDPPFFQVQLEAQQSISMFVDELFGLLDPDHVPFDDKGLLTESKDLQPVLMVYADRPVSVKGIEAVTSQEGGFVPTGRDVTILEGEEENQQP